MQNSQKYIDVIVKLNRFTKEGKLSWIRETLLSPRMIETHKTRYQDKFFLIYQPPYGQVPSSEIGTLYTSSRAILEIVDEENNTIFTFPRLTVINDLYETVISMNEEVDSYLDNFLKDEL